MKVQKFGTEDAKFIRSPGQDGDIEVANLIDQRHDGPMTIGYGRYSPNQTLTETMKVHDVMIVLDGRISVSTADGTVTATRGEVIYMPEGQSVTITTDGEGALTAYATYPHWEEVHSAS